MSMILKELHEKIESINVENTYLYFISRVLKPNVKKTAKALDKFLFNVYQVDVNDEIRLYLHELTKTQLDYLAKKKSELQEYDVITDDTEHLFTYHMKNKAMSFSDVIYNQLKSSPPKVESLANIISDEEELWAYCVGFYDEDDWIYSFRKILSGKVAIDEKDNKSKNKVLKSIRTFFNTKNQKLELLQEETINLDKKVDCIFYKETFYIAQKRQFEQIVGLEEEYKEQATEVIAELENTRMIEGLEFIRQKIEKDPAIHKKLVRLSKIGNYKSLDAKAISKMKTVSKNFGFNLKVNDGKLLIEDDNDIDLALKVLSDYYKRGEISNKPYGTYAGKVLTENNK